MQIRFSPQRSDADLTLAKQGDALIVNGVATSIDEPSEWIPEAGEGYVVVILPHGTDAPEERKFPMAVTVTQDGDIPLPPNGEPWRV